MARAESEETMSRMDNIKTNNFHVMLVGPAGAGKSAFIKSLIQLCKSSDGSPPCDYSYIPPAGGGMLGGHTLMQQTVDSINTLTFTNKSGRHDWSNKTAVEELTAQIRGEKPIDDVDWTDTERDPSPLKHSMVTHPAFSEVDCIAVVLNGQAGIEGTANHHGLVEACRQNTRRRPSFVITHKDMMSGEQIEQMKTALETEYGLDPYTIFFIENITTPNREIVDVDWKSRLCEFLKVCAADGKVGADCHRRRENALLNKLEGQHKYEKDRMEEEIVKAQHALDIIRVTKSQLEADTAQKQVDMLNNELKRVEEMHLLKAECNKAGQSIRKTSKQRKWETKWHQLQISDLQQKLQQSTQICDSLVDTQASLQSQLKDERDIRNHTEMTLKEKDNTILQTQNTAHKQLEQMKIEYERDLSYLTQKLETESKLKDQKERETLKLRNKIQLESHRRSEEQMKKKEENESLQKLTGLMASFFKPKAGLLETCPDHDDLHQNDVLNLEKEQPNDDFADILNHIADDLYEEAQIDSLGGQLGIIQGGIERALMTNLRFNRVTSDGTRHMLKQWRTGVSRQDERIELRNALVAANLKDLADNYFPQDTVNVADDEDQLDCESALTNVSRTETAVPTPDGQSANMDILHEEQATNVNPSGFILDPACCSKMKKLTVGGLTGLEHPQKIGEATGSSGGQDKTRKPTTTTDQPLDEKSSKKHREEASEDMDQHSYESPINNLADDVQETFVDVSSNEPLDEGTNTSNERGVKDIRINYSDLLCNFALTETSSEKLLMLLCMKVIIDVPQKAFGG